MKLARKALVLMILLVTPLFLSGILSPGQLETKASISPSLHVKNTLSYDEHDPIWIQNDTAFHDMASAESWAGTGDPATPYIIEGLNITTDISCILVQHVTLSFEIRNCYFSGEEDYIGAGIGVIDAPLVAIVDTIISGKMVGMELERVDSPVVRGCALTNNTGISIYGLNSEGITIDDCEIYDTFISVMLLHFAYC